MWKVLKTRMLCSQFSDWQSSQNEQPIRMRFLPTPHLTSLPAGVVSLYNLGTEARAEFSETSG